MLKSDYGISVGKKLGVSSVGIIRCLKGDINTSSIYSNMANLPEPQFDKYFGNYEFEYWKLKYPT